MRGYSNVTLITVHVPCTITYCKVQWRIRGILQYLLISYYTVSIGNSIIFSWKKLFRVIKSTGLAHETWNDSMCWVTSVTVREECSIFSLSERSWVHDSLSFLYSFYSAQSWHSMLKVIWCSGPGYPPFCVGNKWKMKKRQKNKQI